MTRRAHPMPFGAELLEDGRVRFRLWAPGANKVELCLQGLAPEARLLMAAEDDGWFGIITELAASGFYYQYRVDEDVYIPDPASRFQPQDVHGSSQVIDPGSWQWTDNDWRGRPWHEAVIYQLHVGTFSEDGSFTGVKKKLDHLVELGISALQLMPIAEFPGGHNWGYDGVLPFAPDCRYGTPDELKELIDCAHGKGLMVFNDVVYNHFGPEGNYLHHYAPAFFNERFKTPWGCAINFSGPDNHWVRRFFIENALYWLEEYHFDGLRFDAVHAIFDDSSPDFLEELAETVREGPGRDRHIHLILENDHNAAHYLRRDSARPLRYYDAQWNDDFHHSMHLLLTGEDSGYYQDYRKRPIQHLGRCLAEGFAYQGEISAYRGGKRRGEPSADLPPTAFVNFLQNHDQVGNRPLGDRLGELCPPEALRAATALTLLSPSPPMLFMGQEWSSGRPFPYFVDVPETLGEQITRGRLEELAHYLPHRPDPQPTPIPLPNVPETFVIARLDWNESRRSPHAEWLAYHRELLSIRAWHLIPRLAGGECRKGRYRILADRALVVHWTLGDGTLLTLLANLGTDTVSLHDDYPGTILFSNDAKAVRLKRLAPWSTTFLLTESDDRSSIR